MARYGSAFGSVTGILLAGTSACVLAAANARAQATPPARASPAVPVAESGAPAPATTARDSAPSPSRVAEEAAIAAELSRMHPQPSTADATAPPSGASTDSSAASASSRGLSNLMNPAISVIGIALGGGTTRNAASAPDDLSSGIAVQEVELRASAIVDPYFRADVSLAGNADELGFEEAYLTTLELPRVTLRAGQMKATLGRHNLLHTHAFPFITAPLPWRALIGPEGLNDPGVSADVLLPLPFYTELTAQLFAGEWSAFENTTSDDPDRRRDRDLAYVAHAKTLFDLSESTTLELGASYVGGRNGFGGMTHILAGDVTLKWRPIAAERYEGVDWTTEYLWVERGRASSDQTRGGGYSALRYHFAQRFSVQARGAILGLPSGDDPRTLRGEALIAFIPSEFSALRLQYALEHAENSDTGAIHEVFAQVVFSVGPHPGHAY